VIVQSKQNFITRSLAFVISWSLFSGVISELSSINGMSYPTAVREWLFGTTAIAFFFISISKIYGGDKEYAGEIKLTLILLTWTKWRAPASASKWRMGFNSAFKGLKCSFCL
jgi:hypothetical protein